MPEKDEIVLKFAQKLANNEPRIRKKTLKKLRGWLATKSKYQNGFSEEELLKLWKGLHYCMWMCDKAVVQEELADSVSWLVHAFPSVSSALMYVRAYLAIQVREWALIDRHRLSKFMMMMRRMLHQTFVRLSTAGWHDDDITHLVSMLSETGVISDNDSVPQGLRWHFIDMYLVELAKVGAQTLSGIQCVELLDPYCHLLATAKHKPLVQYIMDNLIDDIMTQAISEHRHKHSANNRDSSSDIEMDEDTQSHLQFDLGALADRLFDLGKEKSTLTRNRKVIYAKVAQLKNLAAGKFPREKRVEEEVDSDDSIPEQELDDAEQRLVEMEDEIVIGERSRKLENKLRKKRKEEDGEQESDDDADHSMEESEQEPTPKKHKPTQDSDSGTPSDKKEKNKFKQADEKVKMKEKKKQKIALTAERKAEKKKRKQPNATGNQHNNKVHLRDTDELESESHSDPTHIQLPNSNSHHADLLLFEGGFMDSDDETQGEVNVKPSGKKAKKHKGGASIVDALEISDSDSNSKQSSHKKAKNVKPKDDVPNIDTPDKRTKKGKNKKLKKDSDSDDCSTALINQKKEKRRRKKLNDCVSEEGMNLEALFDPSQTPSPTQDGPKSLTNQKADESVAVTTSGKKKRKKRDSQTDSQVEVEEAVEIYVPNKKYKGQHAEWAKQQAQSNDQSDAQPFMKFEKHPPTPPAFIRKALLKVTPKTEPKRGSKKEVEVSGPNSSGKRRVSFGLHRNMAQSTKERTHSPHTGVRGSPSHSQSEAQQTKGIPSQSEAQQTIEIPSESEAEQEMDIPNKSEAKTKVKENDNSESESSISDDILLLDLDSSHNEHDRSKRHTAATSSETQQNVTDDFLNDTLSEDEMALVRKWKKKLKVDTNESESNTESPHKHTTKKKKVPTATLR